MAVVTISRGTFSGGKVLAECLAQKLGHRCVDRDVIVEKAAAGVFPQDEILDALMKPPSFLDRFRRKKYVYLALIQAALAEEVRAGKVVYHGNAGHLLLKGGCTVLRVRIIAPLEWRINMARERLQLSRRAAIAHIEKVDEQRRRWTSYLYNVDWRDPSLYDLVVNLECTTIEEACDVVATMATQKSFVCTPRRQEGLNDLALASRVRAVLATTEATAHLEVEVTARRGVVKIKGRATDLNDTERARRVALEVPGVKEVDVDGLISMTSL